MVDGLFPLQNIFVSSGEYAWSGPAETSWACQGQTMNSAHVKLNQRNMGQAGLTREQMRRITIHELGHALGLHHPTIGCNAAVMMLNACIYTTISGGYPRWGDINGVRDWGY